MAVTIDAATLAEIIGADVPTATRLLAVTTELVDRYAASAPDAIHNEAIIRCSGWLLSTPSTGARTESVGDISTSFSPMMTGALRASGAMALLTNWKVRRGGAI